MTATNGRRRNGRFAPGNAGGPGRPAVAKEKQYAETLQSSCSTEDWEAICGRAILDAKQGDYRAREWLAKYLVGQPPANGLLVHAHAEIPHENSELAKLSDDELLELESFQRELLDKARNR